MESQRDRRAKATKKLFAEGIRKEIARMSSTESDVGAMIEVLQDHIECLRKHGLEVYRYGK